MTVLKCIGVQRLRSILYMQAKSMAVSDTSKNVYELEDDYQPNPAYGEDLKLQSLSSASQEEMLVDEKAKKKPFCDKVYWYLCVWLVLLSILAGVGFVVALGSIVMGKRAASDNSDAIQALRQDLEDSSPGLDADANPDAIQLLRNELQASNELLRQELQAYSERLEAAEADAASNINSLQEEINALTGLHPSIPAASCLQVSLLKPSSPSGYYWVRGSSTGSVRVYCDMSRSCGGVTGNWMRVALLEYNKATSSCPPGLKKHLDSGIHTCGVLSSDPTCVSIAIDTHGVAYSRICGEVLGYQVGAAHVFTNSSIDEIYIDGVGLTHGSNPRQHIWTFAAALDVTADVPGYSCECSNAELPGDTPPAFVGQDYFCDTGLQGRYSFVDHNKFHAESPLWDGAGCIFAGTCCSFNNPPWFHKQLPSPTSDDMEIRVCTTFDRVHADMRLQHAEIYIQ